MQEQISYRFARLYHLIGFVVLCIVSIPLHFTYEWLGENRLIGYVTPVNESIWEHLKLSFWPTLLWWAIGYFVFKERKSIDGQAWFYASFLSLITAPTVIVSYYYTFTAGLNIVSPTLNILSLFIGLLVGQMLALHSYRYTLKPNKPIFGVLLLIVLAFIGMSLFSTYSPPDLPIFIPPNQG